MVYRRTNDLKKVRNHNRTNAWLDVNRVLARRVDDELREIGKRFGSEDKITEGLRKSGDDFILLSEARRDFDDDPISALELDSGIFLAAYLSAVIPEVLAEADVDIHETKKESESPKDYLERKYGLFLLSKAQGKDAKLSPAQRKSSVCRRWRCI